MSKTIPKKNKKQLSTVWQLSIDTFTGQTHTVVLNNNEFQYQEDKYNTIVSFSALSVNQYSNAKN